MELNQLKKVMKEKKMDDPKSGDKDNDAVKYVDFLVEAFQFASTHPEFVELPKVAQQDFCQIYGLKFYKSRDTVSFANLLRVYTQGYVQAKRERGVS